MIADVNPLKIKSMYAMGANVLGAPGLVASWRRSLHPHAHQALLIVSASSSTDEAVHEPAASVTISGTEALSALKAAVDEALGFDQSQPVVEPADAAEQTIAIKVGTLKLVRRALECLHVDKPDLDGSVWARADSPGGCRGGVNLGSERGIVAQAFAGSQLALDAAKTLLDAETGGLK